MAKYENKKSGLVITMATEEFKKLSKDRQSKYKLISQDSVKKTVTTPKVEEKKTK